MKNADIKSLAGLGVWVTRPTAQAQMLCQKIQALGGIPWAFPLIEIQPVQEKFLIEQISLLEQADFVVFNSPNAVASVGHVINQIYAELPAGLKWVAIGPGTKNALEKRGWTVSICPKTSNSEMLLAEPDLQNVKDKTVVLFCGEGGRNLLQTVLMERKANVIRIPVYKRVCPAMDTTNIIKLWQSAKIQVVLVTSGEIVANLQAIFRERAQALLFSTPLIVASQRISELALSLGFKKDNVMVAQGASDEALIDALILFSCRKAK